MFQRRKHVTQNAQLEGVARGDTDLNAPRLVLFHLRSQPRLHDPAKRYCFGLFRFEQDKGACPVSTFGKTSKSSG